MKTITVGKTYRNRIGINLTCTKITEDSLYRYRMESDDKSMRYNVDDAGWFIDATKPSDRDIMEEVNRPTEAEFMAWAQGKEFVTPSGQIVKISAIYTGMEFDWTCLPVWAQYIALDDNGSWRWYAEQPRVCEQYDCWTSSDSLNDSATGYIPAEYHPINTYGGWKDNCHKRP